jgi:hypothetical protein
MTVGAFVVETLRERATAILKGEGDGTPRGTPPARLEDVADAVKKLVDELRQEHAQTMDAVRQQGEALAALRTRLAEPAPPPAPAAARSDLDVRREIRRAFRTGSRRR